MNTLVLARYSEPLNWVKLVPDDFEVIIYNRGEVIDSPDILRRASCIIDRPNEGRESKTYLHHMTTESTNDQGFNVYSQGEAFSHSPDFIRLLETWRTCDNVQERKLSDRPRVRPEREAPVAASCWHGFRSTQSAAGAAVRTFS